MAEEAEHLGNREAWQRAHEALVRIAAERAGLDFDEGEWLLRALRVGAHRELGYASFVEYAGRLFGYGPRLTLEKLRVAEALEELPATAGELREGRLSFSAVRELTRVATRFTEGEWLEAARGRTVREVEQLVSGHRPGDRPDDAPDASLKRHLIRLEVSAETLATLREAMAKIRRDAGGPIDEDAAILLLARQVLGGSMDAGKASYQVALTVCERCRTGQQEGRGELVPLSASAVETAACDALEVGAHTHVGTTPRPRAKQTIPPATRRAVLRRDGGCCVVPGCRHATFLDIHHVKPRSEAGGNCAENLATLCAAHHRHIHDGKLTIERDASTGPLLPT